MSKEVSYFVCVPSNLETLLEFEVIRKSYQGLVVIQYITNQLCAWELFLSFLNTLQIFVVFVGQNHLKMYH